MSDAGSSADRVRGSTYERLALDYAASASPTVFYVESVSAGRLVYISANVERVTGRAPSEFTARQARHDSFVHPDDRLSLESMRSAALSADANSPVRCDYRLETQEGYRWFRDERTLAGDDTFTGCLVDVTAEKAAASASTRDLAGLRKNETASHAREALIQSVMDACPIPIIMSTFDGRILYQNPASLAVFGSAETACNDLLDRDTGEALLQDLHAHGAVDNLEQEYSAADGGSFWGAISARVVEYGGEPVVVSCITDITVRKQAEVKLRESAELVRRVLEAAPLPIRMNRLDDGFLYYESPASRELFGGTRYAVDSFFEPADRAKYLAELRREGTLENAVHRLIRADGSPFMGAISARVIDYEGDTVIVSSTVDLTERHAMEAELRESEEMVRHVLESCPTAIQMTMLDGTVLYQSPVTLELFRESREHTVSNVAERYTDATSRATYLEALFATGSVEDYHVRYRRFDGTEFPCSISSRLVDYKGDKVIVSAFYDLTDEIARENEMARQREALHQSEKLSALGELLAGVAHELNNPLSIVVGQTRLLQETTTDSSAAERAVKIGAAADRCAKIVRTFLAMARQQPHKSTAIDFNETVSGALEVVGYTMKSADIRLTQQLAPDLPAVWGDADQLAQVLANLLINAQHALAEIGGDREVKVSSRYRPGEGEVVVKIKDNGPGVPEALRTRIFEPFFTTKDVGLGTGIGLAFCHRVLAAHGGSIKLDPEYRSGASFVLRLPIARQRPASTDEPHAAMRCDESLSVLVLDDEQEVAEMIAEILRRDGHRVALAASGRIGLSLIEQQTFDVILSDLRMPDLDGQELYRILEKRWPAAVSALAFLTGDTLSASVKAFLDEAGRPYLEKPLLPEDVRELMHSFSERLANK
jgi:PAS domain S-box-containing protein